MLATPFPHAFGLDISDLSIKLVQLRNRTSLGHVGRFDLSVARSVSLPYGLIVDGEIQKPEPVRKYLQHLLKGNKKHDAIASPWVVASLPEKKSFLKIIRVPKAPTDVIDEDVAIASKKHVPFEDDSYYMDWQVIPAESNEEESTVLLAVTAKQVADMYTYLLESVGLGVVALEVESLATARSMITAKKMYDGEARAILDIGASKTVFIVYDNESLQFSTVLPYSGDIVTTMLRQKMNVSHAEAEKLKCSIGLKHEGKNKKAWSHMMKSAQELTKDVKKAIDFYYSHFPSANRITHVTMTGGGAQMSHLDAVLAEALQVTVRAGLPWKNLFPRKAIHLSQKGGLKYATGIGLALRAADNPFFRYDTI